LKYLDRAITALSPSWGIKRLQARMALKAYYEAATPTRYHKTRTDRGNADSVNNAAGDSLRIQARHLEENFDVAKNALDILVDNVVGLGIMPEPQVKRKDGTPHKEYNKILRDLHRDWIKNAYVTDDYGYYDGQRLEARSLFRDGEVLKQHIEGPVAGLKHNTIVPYSIELIEADYLPLEFSNPDKNIVQGVEKNAWGQARAFHVYKHHPGGNRFAGDTKRVSADRMTHVKMIHRIGQTRGTTVFASVLNRFDDIKDICESERVAARVAAAFTFYIKKGMPELYVAPESGSDEREMEMAPGMGLDNLAPGEDYGTLASNRPNNEIVPFIGFNKRCAAGGLGVSYSSLARDYDGGSWSSKRQEANEQYIHYGTLWSYFVSRSVSEDWKRFARMAQLTVDIPSDVDPSTLLDADYSRPPLLVIDANKELSGVEKKLKLQLTSKSEELRKAGKNPDDARATIMQEIEDDKEAGMPPLEFRVEENTQETKDEK